MVLKYAQVAKVPTCYGAKICAKMLKWYGANSAKLCAKMLKCYGANGAKLCAYVLCATHEHSSLYLNIMCYGSAHKTDLHHILVTKESLTTV